nr:uncharacterized protein LOC100176973 [Ciona intestinalis]|eukprot:XP_002130456.1 uncharacterized protein LOC100176973 [Ciona intestinalis]
MLRTQSKQTPTEMSHDYFMETYGNITPSKSEAKAIPGSSGKAVKNGWSPSPQTTGQIHKGEFRSADNRHKGSQKIKMCDHCARNNNKNEGVPCENSHLNDEIIADGCVCEHVCYDVPRRNSRIQAIASRFARKSLRMVSRRKGSTENAYSGEGTKPTDTPTNRWRNSMFKRSQSNHAQENDPESYRPVPHADRVQPVTSPEARDHQPTVTIVRSVSHAPATSSPKNDDSISILAKRHSASCSLTSTEDDRTSPTDDRVLNGILELKKYMLDESEQVTSSGLSNLHSTDKRTDLMENDVKQKYRSIKENEETRMVTIVTLLKRRRNSLKIKCDHFMKDLESDECDKTRGKTIKARLRHMQRKLEVVEQCIEEQKDYIKVAAAKIELKCSLELFNLKLERDTSSLSDVTPTRKKTYSSPTSPNDRFESADETVFDDCSSVSTHSPRNLNSSFDASKPRYGRRTSAPYYQFRNPHNDYAADDDEGRMRSIDCAVTSDCDSGFDNGDALSRSDVSLDRTLSKSTGSIASSASRSVRLSSAHCDDISPGTVEFMPPQSNSSSEQSLCGSSRRGSAAGRRYRARSRRSLKSDEVDTDVLASIAEFENFAEKTMRRLHHNGKLVPLKKGT